MKILSLFSGIGAFEKALTNLNVPFELVGYSEIDKYASKSYAAVHNVDESMNLGDITKINEKELPKNIDLVTYGFPCVPKGFKVKTSIGYKNIEDITTQDEVLTHTNTYQKVVVTMNRISDHINKIKGVGCYDLQLTDEHPVYVYRNNKFEWVKTKDLTTKDNLVYNINTNEIKSDCTDDELWILGRYCADGYRENHSLKRPILCIGSHKVDEFEEHLKGIEYSVIHQGRSCIEYKILDEKLSNILDGFGTGSTKKEIPNWVIDLPTEQLKIFLDGYLSGDGHKRKDRTLTMFCTASEKMLLSLQEIIIKVYRVVPTVSVRVDKRSETFSDTYNGQFSNKPKNQVIINDKIIVPIKNIERIEKDIEVFNFEVENDNSYTVNNIIVHNCQDISIAGKQKGLFNEDGTKTRSGLFFEALRIIEETQPRVAIAENVKNLTGKKFKPQFDIVLKSLEDAGYNNYWQVLNAKDYGIPQNRERVFIVSIRKDIDNGGFKFPKPFDLNLRLKDLLEDEVADKYYINTEKSKLLLQKLKDTNQINDEKVCCDSSINEPKVREISNCITSRYDAGIQKQKQIGLCVVEPNKPIRLGNVYGEQFGGSFGSNVWDKNGIAPTLKTTSAASQQCIIEEQPTLIGGMQKHQSIKTDGISTTLTSSMGSGGGYVPMVVESEPEETDKLIHVGNLTGGKWDKINESCRRVYSEDGLSPTIHTCQGGNTEPKVLIDSTIKKVDIPQTVKCRKYKIDCELLCKCLREHKSNTNLTNKEIAEKLSVPITKVEHWFRQDNSFAIPDSELWLQLKEVLGIKTDEFDKPIMTFEEKEGVYDKSERHYFTDGIAPTLTSTSAGNEKIIIKSSDMNE